MPLSSTNAVSSPRFTIHLEDDTSGKGWGTRMKRERHDSERKAINLIRLRSLNYLRCWLWQEILHVSACEQCALCRLRIRFAISVFPHYLHAAKIFVIMRRHTHRANGCDVFCLHVSTRQCMAAYNHVVQHAKQQAPLKGLLKLICFNEDGLTRRLTPVCKHEAAASSMLTVFALWQ